MPLDALDAGEGPTGTGIPMDQKRIPAVCPWDGGGGDHHLSSHLLILPVCVQAPGGTGDIWSIQLHRLGPQMLCPIMGHIRGPFFKVNPDRTWIAARQFGSQQTRPSLNNPQLTGPPNRP